MHFLITGGAGFIGSHVTEQLLLEGYQVTVVDNLTTGCRQNLLEHPNLKFLCQDISQCQPQDFSKPIDGIAHLAATASVKQSWLDPLAAHHNNLSATMAVIKLCHALAVPRLVFASSAAVYGNPIQIPIEETHLTSPISPYGLHKLMGEQYVDLFAKHYGFSAIALRLFNVFGPRQDPNSPYSGVIAIFSSAMQQDLPITIYGDGTQTRDFVYVKDAAIAFVQALTVPLNSSSCVTCNIATGKSISLLELLEIFKGYFPQWSEEIKFAPSRSGDIKHSQANIDKAAKFLGFAPRYSVKVGLSGLLE